MNGQEPARSVSSSHGNAATLGSNRENSTAANLTSSWLKDIVSDPMRAAEAGILRSDNNNGSSHGLAAFDAPPVTFPYQLNYPIPQSSIFYQMHHSMMPPMQNVVDRAQTTITSSSDPRLADSRLLVAAGASNKPPRQAGFREPANDLESELPAKRVKTEPPSLSQSTPSSIPHRPDYFRKGSIIQLGDNKLKKIENLQSSDFESSANLSPNLCLDSSTVTKITEDERRGTAFLTFSVGNEASSHSQVVATVEATMEHPFFVYGRGWSSVCPKRTLSYYNLPCHKLEVNDRCISLTYKDPNVHIDSRPPPTALFN